jgi:G:T-mismatch repair DNA endonuclease (very short patch repair protein)
MKKYGTKSVYSKGAVSFLKREETLKKMGVSNVFQLPSVKDKIKSTLLARYGTENAGRLAVPKSKSNPHSVVEKLLRDLGVEYTADERDLFKKFNRALGKVYSPIPDLAIHGSKLVIEIYGDYYHASPKEFKAEDDLNLNWRRGKIKAKDVWKFDLIRQKHIESFGYKVLVLWEHEIKDLEATRARVITFLRPA